MGEATMELSRNIEGFVLKHNHHDSPTQLLATAGTQLSMIRVSNLSLEQQSSLYRFQSRSGSLCELGRTRGE